MKPNFRNPYEAATYAKAKQLIAERNEAISQARFWRTCALVLAASGLLGNIAALGKLSGWW